MPCMHDAYHAMHAWCIPCHACMMHTIPYHAMHVMHACMAWYACMPMIGLVWLLIYKSSTAWDSTSDWLTYMLTCIPSFMLWWGMVIRGEVVWGVGRCGGMVRKSGEVCLGKMRWYVVGWGVVNPIYSPPVAPMTSGHPLQYLPREFPRSLALLVQKSRTVQDAVQAWLHWLVLVLASVVMPVQQSWLSVLARLEIEEIHVVGNAVGGPMSLELMVISDMSGLGRSVLTWREMLWGVVVLWEVVIYGDADYSFAY